MPAILKQSKKKSRKRMGDDAPVQIAQKKRTLSMKEGNGGRSVCPPTYHLINMRSSRFK